jgi:toxin ParE1/3/4
LPGGNYRVKWLRTALKNLECEAEYLAEANPKAAAAFVAKVQEAVSFLEQYPAMGRPGRVPETRELVISDTPYIVPYRVKGKRIEILRPRL